MTTTIVIADDHSLFRKGVRNHLEAFDRFQVIGEANDGEELFTLVKSLKPDVIIADIKMPKLDGIQSTKKILKNYPRVKIIAMSFLDNEFAVVDMLEAGAKGYLCKNIEPGELEMAIDTVISGQPYFSLGSRSSLIQEIAKSKYNPFLLQETKNLTDREIQIIQLTCEDKTTHEIGCQLDISSRTVETHKQGIYKKIGVNSIAGLIIYAIRNGLYILPQYHRNRT